MEENRGEVFGEGAIEAEERWKEMFNRITGNELVTASTLNDILWNTSLDKISLAISRC